MYFITIMNDITVMMCVIVVMKFVTSPVIHVLLV